MFRKAIFLAGLGGAVLAMTALVGCDQSASPPDQATKQQQTGDPKPGAGKGDEEHGHKPGAHGGIIVPLGRDSYHAEAVFEKGGTVRLYMLGQDEARIQEVDVQELVAFVTPAGSAEAEQVKFAPKPQPGDGPGKTSLFVAELPPGLRGKVVQV